MDYDDYVNNSDDDYSDDEIYELVIAGCHAAVTYYTKYIDKQPCRNFEQTGSMWLLRCLTGNKSLCRENFRMKPHVFS